jgi:urease accessory protein
MNIIGPYSAQQLLLHALRPIVTEESKQCGSLRTGLKHSREDNNVDRFDEAVLTFNGPAMTWPLGEILATRHDLQHSRIFNS